MTLRTSGKFPVPEGTFGKDFQRSPELCKATESFQVEAEEALNIVFQL